MKGCNATAQTQQLVEGIKVRTRGGAACKLDSTAVHFGCRYQGLLQTAVTELVNLQGCPVTPQTQQLVEGIKVRTQSGHSGVYTCLVVSTMKQMRRDTHADLLEHITAYLRAASSGFTLWRCAVCCLCPHVSAQHGMGAGHAYQCLLFSVRAVLCMQYRSVRCCWLMAQSQGMAGTSGVMLMTGACIRQHWQLHHLISVVPHPFATVFMC